MVSFDECPTILSSKKEKKVSFEVLIDFSDQLLGIRSKEGLDVQEREVEMEDSSSCNSDDFGSSCDERETMNE